MLSCIVGLPVGWVIAAKGRQRRRFAWEKLNRQPRSTCYGCGGRAVKNLPPGFADQTMNSTDTWKALFSNWPKGIAPKGVLVSTLNESIPFKGFMVSGDMLLLERTNPDPLGARFIFISYDAINCVKLIDPLKESIFTAAGFTGKLTGV
jgi:hypothetical protein